MTDYLDLDDALQVIDHMGFHVRDAGMLASALARPGTTVGGHEVYPGLEDKAAALMEALARFHPLIDGNKRTSWVLTSVFLRLNEWKLDSNPAAFDFVLAVASGSHGLDEIAKRLRVEFMIPLA